MSGIAIAWTVVGAVVAVVIGIGVGVMSMTPPDFWVARAAFVLAVSVLAVMTIVWTVRSLEPMWWRVTASVLVGVTVFVLFPESLRWVSRRESEAAAQQRTKEVESKSVLSPTTVQPELTLISPTHPHAYQWVPLRRVFVDQGPSLPNELAAPVFRMANLSDAVVTGVIFEWSVLHSASAEQIFLASDCFRAYAPRVDPSEQMFWLERKILNAPHVMGARLSDGSGMRVADTATVDIPYCTPHQQTEVVMPLPVANSIAIRIVATTPRPPKTNMPSGVIAMLSVP